MTVTPDLSLVPTDDLLEALKARCEHMIFSALAISGYGDDPNPRYFKGHSVFCQGLCADLIRDIQDWEREEVEDDA